MQLITQQLTVPELTVSPEAEQKRNELAMVAAGFTQVTNEVEQNSAVEAARDCKSYCKEIEEARLGLTRPLDATKAQIMAIERDHLDPLRNELARVESLVTEFQLAEYRRVQAEEAARHKAYELAEQNRIEADNKARAALDRARTEKGMAVAIEAENAALAAEQRVLAIIREPLPEVIKAKGVATRQELMFEVIDIKAVYAARPELCKLEISPAAVKSTCVPEMPVPGLKLWFEHKSSVRRW